MPRLLPTDAMKTRIIRDGAYDEAENRRIFDKWFARGPRQQFQEVNARYHLTDKVMCDIGCGYGMNLLYTQPESYGIEVDHYAVTFARSLGLKIYDIDFMHTAVDDLPKVDVVWCSAVLEHVESVHAFLRRIALLLKDDGLMVIFVPTIPLIPALGRLPVLSRYLNGYLYGDHINFFTPSSLRLTCERAGFQTLDCCPFLPAPFSLLNDVPLVNRLVDGVTFVGRKIPDWQYPQNATRIARNEGDGFVYHEWFEDGSKKDG